jgi:hypothetical protein
MGVTRGASFWGIRNNELEARLFVVFSRASGEKGDRDCGSKHQRGGDEAPRGGGKHSTVLAASDGVSNWMSG